MGIFEKAIVNGEEILDFIPQRKPMLMVDSFYGIQNEVSYSSFEITDDNIFCKNGIFDECGVIEHMAQSAALRIGYLYRQMGKDVPLGFIGSVKDLKIYKEAKVGNKLLTTITILQQVFNITLVIAHVTTADGDEICECKMKIFLEN